MAAEQDSLRALAEVNAHFVAQGESLPAVSLPDGSKVQTGTVGAMLQNIKLYDRVCAGEEIEGEYPSFSVKCGTSTNMRTTGLTKAELEKRLVVPIPTLVKVGLFDLFAPDEWLAGSSVGRRFVGMKAKEMGY